MHVLVSSVCSRVAWKPGSRNNQPKRLPAPASFLLALFAIVASGGYAARAQGWELILPGGTVRLSLGFSDGRQFQYVPRVAPPPGRAFGTPAVYEQPLPGGSDQGLSPAARQVSMIALQNGDRDFLMVDKVHGRLILFRNGRPVYSRAALTGASQADQLPPDSWTKSWHEQSRVERYKVTPAGRFTLTRNYDRDLGKVFDINELRGRDWVIAIHKVWLGNGSEHRDARLRSAADVDKHITDGCVDVDSDTIAELLRMIPGRGMPVYILPTDNRLIPEVFSARERLYRVSVPVM